MHFKFALAAVGLSRRDCRDSKDRDCCWHKNVKRRDKWRLALAAEVERRKAKSSEQLISELAEVKTYEVE